MKGVCCSCQSVHPVRKELMGDLWWRGEPLTLRETDGVDRYVMAAHTIAGMTATLSLAT